VYVSRLFNICSCLLVWLEDLLLVIVLGVNVDDFVFGCFFCD